MNYNLRRQFRSLIPVLKRCYDPGHMNFEAKYSRFIVANASELKLKPLSKFNVISNQIRKVSSSNLAKSKTNENNPKDDSKNILDDEEFRNILSDFAKDFGVGSDSEPILEEIRKSIDDPLSDIEKGSDQEETCSNAVESKEIPNIINSKFKEFSETDNFVIPSYEELQNESDDAEYVFHIDTPKKYEFSPEQFKRGVSGVYEINELIEVLRKENLVDITTISVPKELHYTDFLVIATAKSVRHSRAICEHVIKLYKMKKHLKDPFVIVEGEKTSEWKAIDMGNIVLHIFLEETRTLYDIESLWLFDAAFDRGGNQKTDPLYNVIEEQMAFFTSLNDSFTKKPPQKTL